MLTAKGLDRERRTQGQGGPSKIPRPIREQVGAYAQAWEEEGPLTIQSKDGAVDQVDLAKGNWSDTENDLIVADYLEMLRLELSGQPFVEAHRNEALRAILKRSRSSIEFKHQNISAILQRLGLPWIAGYKPMLNSQESLTFAVERHYESILGVANILEANESSGLEEARVLIFEDPPPLQIEVDALDEGNIARLVRKFDPAERDMRNRNLGKRGEELMFNWERTRLLSCSLELANRVRWVSQDDGDGAGYDILSFEPDGRERLVEVKTTVGGVSTPFFISKNEVELSRERPDSFKLIRLFDFTKLPRAFELSPPLDMQLKLEPINFIAKFS